MSPKLAYWLWLFVLPISAFAQETINDASINAGETVTLESGNTYMLDGYVFVEEGATLVIEPGVIIKALPENEITTGNNASALIVARGGKIQAEGTAQNPIIFTAKADDVNDPNDLGPTDRGLWGGIILLGRASTNRGREGQIEGIPTDEARGAYGVADAADANDADDSGVMRYVSIRHGGAVLGTGDEINGLTFGAVGSSTVIEHIEVYSNLDDGFEWFGGTVNTKWLVAAFCGDDGFDYDEGWRGNNQYWFAIQSSDSAGRVGEHDGGTVQETAEPFSTPNIYNATYIGPGTGAFPQGDGSEAIIFRDNAGGTYGNSIISMYNGANGGNAVTVEDIEGADSRERLEQGDLVLTNNLWWMIAAGDTLEDSVPQDFLRTHLADNNNAFGDPGYGSVSRTNDGGLDPRPSNAAATSGAVAPPSDSFFTATDYKGAFAPSADLWTNGWTALSDNGHTPAGETVTITDAFINAGENRTLSAGTEYLLDGFVFVEEGATLTIEPGTVIKALQTPTSSDDNTSALIVARGGQLIANGTAQNPIVFTSNLDDISNPTDLGPTDRGLWGGIILLGRASTNRGREGQIEGIPTDEARGAYGVADAADANDADNSGSLRYVSIRHAGSVLGTGDEINGLTMGAVGSGTTIEYVEVYANLDDGFEWFGGTVNTKYLIAAFCGDDGFDYDEGWRGKNQFWFAVQSADSAGRVGEHDGGTVQETAEPFSRPYIVNATYIGPGVNAFPSGDGSEAIIFRDNAGGIYMSSIITDYNGANGGNAVSVEDIEGADSRERLEGGDLALQNNLWWGFAAGNTVETAVPQDFLRTHLTDNSNSFADPQLGGISRTQDEGLNPRPSAGGPAASGATQPDDTFFTTVSYRGAFSPSGALWTDGWTALDVNDHTGAGGNTGVTTDRWVGHVTRLNAGFQTNLHMYNTGSADASMTLHPYALDGSALTPRTANVPAGEIVVSSNNDLFGEDVSHFFIEGSEAVTVTASYRADVDAAATAELNESSAAYTKFSFYAADWNLVFDGLALINVGPQPATVTVTQRDAMGNELASATIVDGLASGAKQLYTFTAQNLSDNPGSLIEVTSTQPASVVLLRGTYPGVSPAFLYVTVPVTAE
ncbi:hypothetical protein SCOR_27200 [Sulfidibacter corallicola]|uniref:T9SS C-terminal target domain-containing protein n=1 Tax=Sulfidibacter corallicola TaxID=2818388 RepID=A0A8A4TL83_SULCO|nr:hypothetical protein [Sulfidibacter corallicola]QTD50759.1 hypothetical protein J3U87_34680 [Sulfidibacter corallicola]